MLLSAATTAAATTVAATKCDDTKKNGDETGVDCGGSCPACPTCSDKTKNGDETGVDCGGSCKPCVCTCANGTPADAAACPATGTEMCKACSAGFQLANNRCFNDAKTCRCADPPMLQTHTPHSTRSAALNSRALRLSFGDLTMGSGLVWSVSEAGTPAFAKTADGPTAHFE